MKKLMTVALLAVGMASFAQTGKKATTENKAATENKVATDNREVKEGRGEKKGERALERFNDLNLSKEQEQKVLELYKKTQEEKSSDKKLSNEEMASKRDYINQQLKTILTAEQYKKYEANKRNRLKGNTKK